ncbi:MAG: hypothetical protein V4805_04785 [Pseudomonadota bacterium]
MKTLFLRFTFIFTTALLCCIDVRAQDVIDASDSKAYASVIFGNGVAEGDGLVGDTSLDWHAFEVRFGTRLDGVDRTVPALFSGGGAARLDFVYVNEGHPHNHHRDGFSTQIVIEKMLHQHVSAELGIGPYLNMDTTRVDGIEYNQQRWGGLLSLALRFELGDFMPGTQLRLGFNRIAVQGAHASNSLMIGIGREFPGVAAKHVDDRAARPVWAGLTAIAAQTNHSYSEPQLGYSFDAVQERGQWAASLSVIEEGDDGVQVDRRGIAAQAWYVQPLSAKWSASAGIGPYFADNRRDAGDAKFIGLISFKAERQFGASWRAFAQFSRVVTFEEKNDRDLFQIGVMRRFGR